MRMLKEKVALSRQMAHRYREIGQPEMAAQVDENGRVDEESVVVIEQLIQAAVSSNTAAVGVGHGNGAGGDE